MLGAAVGVWTVWASREVGKEEHGWGSESLWGGVGSAVFVRITVVLLLFALAVRGGLLVQVSSSAH